MEAKAKPKVNTRKSDAVTISTVHLDDHLIVWWPGQQGSRMEVTITSPAYTDEDGTMVIDGIVDGHERQFSTSELGLTGDRYTGEWVAIAIHDDTDGTSDE